MKQEEKDLIYKDLCARLPYNVFINCTEEDDEDTNFDCLLMPSMFVDYLSPTQYWVIKPYLRSRSKMTKEERDYEVGNFMYDDLLIKQKLIYKYIEWLNSRHIDYNGLIEKGLALEAPENMYNLKKI